VGVTSNVIVILMFENRVNAQNRVPPVGERERFKVFRYSPFRWQECQCDLEASKAIARRSLELSAYPANERERNRELQVSVLVVSHESRRETKV
jgi:hypothetical protein